MNLKSIAKYDIYSDPRIPFDVSTWLRGHKFNPVAVNITRSLHECETCKAGIAALEQQLEHEEQKLRALIAQAKQRMEDSNGI